METTKISPESGQKTIIGRAMNIARHIVDLVRNDSEPLPTLSNGRRIVIGAELYPIRGQHLEEVAPTNDHSDAYQQRSAS